MNREDLRRYISIVYFKGLDVERLLMLLINSKSKTKLSKNPSKYKKNNSGERTFSRNDRKKKRRKQGQKELDI